MAFDVLLGKVWMTIIANTIWAGTLPYGFRFFGIHVILELAVEVILIWLLLHKKLKLPSVSLRVLIANVVSFLIGSLALNFFSVPKESLSATALIWFAAFLVSWGVEALVFRFKLNFESNIEVWRATFWGNVASYSIAAAIFLIYLRGGDIPGLFIR